MRVLVDAHMLNGRETGNHCCVRGLLDGLAALDDVAVGAAVRPGYAPEASAPGSIAWLPLPATGDWRRLFLDLNRMCRTWRADVLHSSYILPWPLSCPGVVSVQDVSFRRYPGYFSRRDRLLFATLLPWSLRRAAVILTRSGHARQELRAFYPRLRVPIRVVPGAPHPRFRPLEPASLEPVLRRHGVRRPFVLAVGSLQPRKNLSRLIEAYADVHRRHPGLHLAVAGLAGFQASSIQRQIVERDLFDPVHLLGYVTDEDLPALYNAAIALVYPSVYEGFGLPVLEAMACGRPVIAANTSSLPEVAGDAALLVDPFHVGALGAAIERLVTDRRLAEELSDRGLDRARQFSWRRSAEAAVSAYRVACGSEPA